MPESGIRHISLDPLPKRRCRGRDHAFHRPRRKSQQRLAAPMGSRRFLCSFFPVEISYTRGALLAQRLSPFLVSSAGKNFHVLIAQRFPISREHRRSQEHSRYREHLQVLANAMEERIGIFPAAGSLSLFVPFVVLDVGLPRNFTLLRGIIVRNILEPGIYRCVSF